MLASSTPKVQVHSNVERIPPAIGGMVGEAIDTKVWPQNEPRPKNARLSAIFQTEFWFSKPASSRACCRHFGHVSRSASRMNSDAVRAYISAFLPGR